VGSLLSTLVSIPKYAFISPVVAVISYPTLALKTNSNSHIELPVLGTAFALH